MISVFDDKKNCCGCTACKNICPRKAIIMKSDEEGFLYPRINQELCIDCGLCRKVCAFQNGYKTSNNLEIPEIYALKHKSDNVRKNSSSGGAFTAISDYILSENGVIYGVTYDKEFYVIHQREETLEGRNRFRGSKYVQSDLKEVFSQVNKDLINDRFVLFTGTACQVAGLESYLAQSKANTMKLITVDIICHGTPSPRIFQDYILYLEKKNKSKVKQYYFRSKVNGWGHTEEVVFDNGKHDYNSAISQTHKDLFYSNLCLRPSCYQCKYTNFLRPADITIADYWGIENHLPEFKDVLGVSAVIINTEKGRVAFSKLSENVDAISSNLHDCAKRQANLYNPSSMNPRRDEFWNDYLKYGFEYIIRKYTGYGYKKEIKSILRSQLKKVGLLSIKHKISSKLK